jgi:plasmid maintenance system antidote protein VapI
MKRLAKSKLVPKLVRLSKLRRSWERSELSMAALGKKVGLTRNQVWYAVHGRPVTPKIAAKFAAALGVKLPSLRS